MVVVPGMIGGGRHRHPHSIAARTAAVYLLELAGQDDAFATAEAHNAATDVRVLAPGLALAAAIDPDRVRGLAFTRRVGELVDTVEVSIDAATAAVEAATIDRAGSVAVRARDVRGTADVSTQALERSIGAVLTDAGLVVDLETPDHELRVCCSDDVCTIAWLAVESVRDYGDRAPTDRPFFQPGSMDPLEARAVANLAGAGPDQTVLDPLCGTGGLLIEAGTLGATVVGSDAQARMVRGARDNLSSTFNAVPHLALADATRLPVRPGVIDAVVCDVPYGRQSWIAATGAAALVDGVLAEARRVADRAVVVADRSLEPAARAADWVVTDRFERRVHRSLTRHVHVLASTHGD